MTRTIHFLGKREVYEDKFIRFAACGVDTIPVSIGVRETITCEKCKNSLVYEQFCILQDHMHVMSSYWVQSVTEYVGIEPWRDNPRIGQYVHLYHKYLASK